MGQLAEQIEHHGGARRDQRTAAAEPERGQHDRDHRVIRDAVAGLIDHDTGRGDSGQQQNHDGRTAYPAHRPHYTDAGGGPDQALACAVDLIRYSSRVIRTCLPDCGLRASQSTTGTLASMSSASRTSSVS